MEGHSTPHSLAELAGKTNQPTKEQEPHTIRHDATPETLESNIQKLLEKNSNLTKQLESSLLKIARLRKQRSVLLDVIVKSTKDDDAYDDDDDSDLSVGDLDSDVYSSDEELMSAPKKRAIKEEESAADSTATTAVKRKKNAQAPTAQQPKRQRTNKPIEVKKDENGNFILPVQLGRVKLLSLGEIIPEEQYYTQNHIFPVGYSIQRTFRSMVQEDVFTMYTCSIEKDENNKPVFCIEGEDAPEIVIRKPTPTDAWAEVLRRSNILRKKVYKNTVSGPEYYGLSSATIRKMVQELPRANECTGYQWTDY